MAEWYIPAIISYQAIHNNFTLNKINKKISLNKMVDYLESKILSMNSKEPVKKEFWNKKNKNDIRIIYTAVKMSEKEGNIFDVRNLYQRKLTDIDLLTYSFPCQDLSQQGKQKGMKKNSHTRSGLLWEIEKALDNTPKHELPLYLLMENVVALTNKNNHKELQEWLNKLKSIGYKNDLRVLNAGDFGSSQARRRVFMISSLKNKVLLPKGSKKPKPINNILDKIPLKKDFLPALDKYDLSDFRRTKSNICKAELKDYTSFNSESYVYDPAFTGPTLTASGANSRIKFHYDNLIRKINARESYKYMGFEEKDFNKVNKINYLSEIKKIFTCGNSISIEVLEKIMEKIYQNFNDEKGNYGL